MKKNTAGRKTLLQELCVYHRVVMSKTVRITERTKAILYHDVRTDWMVVHLSPSPIIVHRDS